MDAKKALDRAQWLCSQSEKCTFDIKKKLLQWDVDEMEGEKIINALLEDEFINESRYAISFAREKSRFNKWGPKKIEMALRAKRIADEHIAIALAESAEHSNDDMLRELLTSKAKTIKAKDSYDLKTKLIRFGMSRGFEYGRVLGIVEKIVEP
ncbi:MAG: regulatory protein RecX [Tenuifilaceae bacterium]|nr:regulatory protein RecX [Tenuifilaceae bacterium]